MIEAGGRLTGSAEFPGRQGRLTFTVLAWERRQIARDQLADILWPDQLPDSWDTALNAIVSKLRRTLSTGSVEGALDCSNGVYELRLPPGSWIDVQAGINALDLAEGALRTADFGTALSEATVSSAIFSRPLLSGETLPWAETRRRELADLYVRTLDCLCRVWLAKGDCHLAARAGRRMISLAPYRESAYAALMRCHLVAGNRAEALKVYADLERLLEEELGVSPSPDVESLYVEALG
jgi:DNA-binding SARP family transcriptional activator